RHHRVEHARVERRGRVVVEVDQRAAHGSQVVAGRVESGAEEAAVAGWAFMSSASVMLAKSPMSRRCTACIGLRLGQTSSYEQGDVARSAAHSMSCTGPSMALSM